MKQKKRTFPKSIRVYFPNDKEKILQDIEKLANDLNMPVSSLCVNLMSIGLPSMQHFSESVKNQIVGKAVNISVEIKQQEFNLGDELPA